MEEYAAAVTRWEAVLAAARRKRAASSIKQGMVSHGGRQAYQRAKATEQPGPVLGVTWQGRVHTDPAEMASAVWAGWGLWFCTVQAVRWQDAGRVLRAALDDLAAPAWPDLSPLTAADLAAALARTPSHTSEGVDGWHVSDLSLLPQEAWQEFATVCALVEAGAPWPDALTFGRIVLIPKGSTHQGLIDAASLRPITVLSQLFRLWGRARMAALTPWARQWTLPLQAGLAGGMGAAELLWSTAAEVESAVVGQCLMAGVSFDLTKAFDTVAWEVLEGR